MNQHSEQRIRKGPNKSENREDASTRTNANANTIVNVNVDNMFVSGGNRQRREVLSEEQYTYTLSKIITRDYYPSLPTLNRDAAILQQRSEGDIAGAVAIRRAARSIAMNEELSNKSEQVEELIANANGGIRKRPRPIERENLDGFHARVTSEDNAEFEMNMRHEARLKREQMDIVFNASGSEYKMVKQRLLEYDRRGSFENTVEEQEQKRLCDTPLMASDEFNPPIQRIQAAGTTADGKNKTDRNCLFFTPNHYDTEDTCNQSHKGTNIMTLEGIHDENTNMPPPSDHLPPGAGMSSLPPSHLTTNKFTRIELRSNIQKKMHLVEYQAKPSQSADTKEKQIIPSNTRFSHQKESRLIVSSNRIEHRTVEASTPRTLVEKHKHYETDSSTTDLDASPLPLDMERRARLTRIELDRDTYVAMTPLIIPGGGDRDDDSPIITWGNVASTPLVRMGVGNLGSREGHDVEFRLPGMDQTEVAAKAAELKVTKQTERFKEAGRIKEINRKEMDSTPSTARSRKRSCGSSTTSVFDRAGSLTPAARSLLERSTPNHSRLAQKSSSSKDNVAARSSSAFGSALRSSYTPKLQKLSGSRQRKSNVYKATPLAASRESARRPNPNEISSSDQNLTSNQKGSATAGLLKLS